MHFGKCNELPCRHDQCNTSTVPRKTAADGRQRFRSPRPRLGHEAPGQALHGPPITITCHCGTVKKLAYGERWQCDTCGLRWDTRQIERDQYQRIRAIQVRFRLLPICIGVVVGLLAALFLFTHNGYSLFLLIPGALVAWMTVLRPMHRSRYRAAIADLPKWELRPERDHD